MHGKRFGGHEAGFFVRPSIGSACAEIAQYSEPALTHNLVSDFVDGCEDSADAARSRLVRNRAVSHRKVGLFGIAFPPDMKLNIFHPRGRTTSKRCIDERLQHIPNLGPAFSYRLSQSPRVLGAKDWSICIVID